MKKLLAVLLSIMMLAMPLTSMAETACGTMPRVRKPPLPSTT